MLSEFYLHKLIHINISTIQSNQEIFFNHLTCMPERSSGAALCQTWFGHATFKRYLAGFPELRMVMNLEYT